MFNMFKTILIFFALMFIAMSFTNVAGDRLEPPQGSIGVTRPHFENHWYRELNYMGKTNIKG